MEEINQPLTSWGKLGLVVIIVITAFLIGLIIFTVFPPDNFPAGTFIHVDRGDTVSIIAGKLKDKNLIRSEEAFKIFTFLLGGEKRMQTGTYFFKTPMSVINVSIKITNRYLGYKPYPFTVFEGMPNAKIATALAKLLPSFDKQEFLTKTKELEGKLFPDTYFLSKYDTIDEIIMEMNQNYMEHLSPYRAQILLSGHSLEQILTMASIIERETNTDEARHLVSGILWKRLSLNMPLQVDVARETYKERGLPDQPIANPGLEAIEATLNPVESPYLYYLTGRDGKMYYAKDFATHKKNVRLYLR